MSEKKKIAKPAGKKIQEIRTRTAKPAEHAHAGEVQRGGPPPMTAQAQLAAFEGAMKLFHARRLADAREMFRTVTAGPERDVAQRAQLHIVMCDRRLASATVEFHSADDHYNYGVALINSRNASLAREHLETASRMAPGTEHIHYALGVASAMAGDMDGAYANLKLAIELEPRNRIAARQDPDLLSFSDRPPLDELLYPERAGW
jgi:Flp pilus assembly protein TadD